MRWVKWLYPGMRVKRWIALFAFGIFIEMLAAAFLWHGWLGKQIELIVTGSFLFFLGVTLMIIGIRKMMKSFITVFLPHNEQNLVDIMFRQRHLSKGPNIVGIGGGTGLSVLLQGLKEASSNITAIVTVGDDGGSSGRLRAEFDVLPPGDIRNCLVALADSESLMRDLFQYRFSEGEGLKGHSFGNLFITALSKITGDFEKAIKESSKVLAIRGQVVPSTLEKVTLVAKREDGTQTSGESAIPKGTTSPISKLFLNPVGCKPTAEALQAIRDADVIVIGPGSLYTSIMPNLVVEEITKEIVRSRAIKIYVCNVMTQHGETDGYTASAHLDALRKHSDPAIVDFCIVNTGKIPDEFLSKYKEEGSCVVEADIEKIRDMGVTPVEADVVKTGEYVRHNSEKLAGAIMSLVAKNRVVI